MSEYPSMPLFTDAFMADTGHLDATETGAYLCLLMAAWRSPDCALQHDDARLARMARCDPKTWKQVRDSVLAFWTKNGEKIEQKRLTKERHYVDSLRSRNARAGAASALKRKELVSTGVAVTLQPSVQPNKQQNTNETGNKKPTPIPIPIESIPLPLSKPSRLPASVPDRDGFDLIDQALRNVEGIRQHPVAINIGSGIKPILDLIELGYELQNHILPSIKRQVSIAKIPIKSFGYFVPGIKADTEKTSAVPFADFSEWDRRLTYAREKKIWAEIHGFPPGHKLCRVPKSLLRPGDGEGWQPWRPE